MISIHALLAESDVFVLPHCQLRFISIHALLAESDIVSLLPRAGSRISIHALLAESDITCNIVLSNILLFLSTLSLRRATVGVKHSNIADAVFLSTLSLRRATLLRVLQICPPLDFYPRSPCGERRITIITTYTAWKFLSTLSLRRATEQSASYNAYLEISIHALLAESDQ